MGWICTAGGSGLSPKAPGTAGSLVGLLLFLPILTTHPLVQMTTVLGLGALSYWSIEKLKPFLDGNHDDSRIVIDEVLGMMIALIGLPMNFFVVILAFGFFRLFDIYKIFPADWIDQNLEDSRGVLLDDVVAGVYACTLMHVGLLFFNWLVL